MRIGVTGAMGKAVLERVKGPTHETCVTGQGLCFDRDDLIRDALRMSGKL